MMKNMGSVMVKSKTPVFLMPFDYCRDAVDHVFNCIAHRPFFTFFMCSSITIASLVLLSQRAQQIVTSFPYDKYLSKFKSQKMITVYATVLEVILELLMTTVLAGVSVIVTLWLLFEEVTDRKKKIVTDDLSGEEFLPPRESKIPVMGKNQ